MQTNYFESYEYKKSQYYLKKCMEETAVLRLSEEQIRQASICKERVEFCHGFGMASEKEGLGEAVNCALMDMSVNALIKPQSLIITIFADVTKEEAKTTAEYIKQKLCEKDAEVLLGFSRQKLLRPFEVMITAYTLYPKEKAWGCWGSREVYEAERKMFF